jgi:hypothetical protein
MSRPIFQNGAVARDDALLQTFTKPPETPVNHQA